MIVQSSTHCPNCNNTLWDRHSGIDGEIAKCTNCHYERPYVRRQRQAHITPSQQASIDRIKAFMVKQYYTGELHRFAVTVEAGFVEVIAEISPHYITNVTAQFFVYSRGRIAVKNVFAASDAYSKKQFYQTMLS